MITFSTPKSTFQPTPQQLLDILTNLSQSDIQQLCELLGPCQMSVTLHNTLTDLQTFNSPF